MTTTVAHMRGDIHGSEIKLHQLIAHGRRSMEAGGEEACRIIAAIVCTAHEHIATLRFMAHRRYRNGVDMALRPAGFHVHGLAGLEDEWRDE